MSVFLVTGKPRTGKTCLIAGLGLIFADYGVKVHSNLDLKSSNSRIITPYNLVELMDGGRVSGMELIVIHEIYAFFHSHKSMSDINLFGGAFICQSAKLGYMWLIDSQLINKVDDNFRSLAEYRYEAVRDEEQKCFTYYELDTSITDRDVRTGESFSIPYFLASTWWNRYDTYTPNPIIGLADLKVKMQKLEPKIMNETINNQVSLLLQNRKELGFRSIQDVSTISVKSALLELNQSFGFSDFVAVRFRRELLKIQ